MSSATPACRPMIVIMPASAREIICRITFETKEGRPKPPYSSSTPKLISPASVSLSIVSLMCAG